eukprot:366354-Chlamydomonas_euryale.AAC.11
MASTGAAESAEPTPRAPNPHLRGFHRRSRERRRKASGGLQDVVNQLRLNRHASRCVGHRQRLGFPTAVHRTIGAGVDLRIHAASGCIPAGGAWAHGRKDAWAHGRMDARAHGRMGVRTHGAHAHGCMAHGRMGAHAHTELPMSPTNI